MVINNTGRKNSKMEVVVISGWLIIGDFYFCSFDLSYKYYVVSMFCFDNQKKIF